jgi:hypothetical protein
MLIKGKIEQFTPRTTSGWLTLPGEPDKKLLLEMVLDGKALKVVAANRYRADLERAGWAGGECGFQIDLDPPLTAAQAERAKLRISGTDLCLELPREAAPASAPSEVSGEEGLKVFIVGSPRSGTSVLLRAIASVFKLPRRGESHVVPGVARVIHGFRQYSEGFADAPAGLLIKDFPIRRFEDSVFEQVRDFYRTVYPTGEWVDKTPSDEAVYSAGLIRRLFPDAKIIVTKRNGIEVVDSFRRKFHAPFENAARNWVSVMQGIEQLALTDPDILVVDQFDFTNTSLDVGKQIAAYLGQPKYGTKIARFFQNDREDKLSKHNWSRQATLDDVQWSDAEKRLFLDVCGETMARFGYLTDGGSSRTGSEDRFAFKVA